MCKPLTQGGLCIRSIEKVNKVLLGKWLWRVGIRFRIHDGQWVRFWHDEWCKQMVLQGHFSNLYSLD